MRWDIAPHLIMIQSRLYSPGYAGPGRWVVFQPKERRAFSAIGPDVVPDIVRILAKACGGADEQEVASVVPHVNRRQLAGLADAGLLVEPSHNGGAAEDSFIAHYQLASFNYPFEDYFDPDWRDKEEKLLQHYDSLWPPPASIAKREGRFHPLPAAELSDLERGSTAPTLKWVSSLLRYTFGPIGEIKTSRLICLRRTSPSGGARHPTEGAVLLPEPLGDIPAGSYVYDVERHGLVESPEEAALSTELRGVGDIGIMIRTRVERAMWRYRDLRAWRPVLLDAGHIVETLSLLLARRGLNSHVVSAPPSQQSNLAWLEEPDLALIIASRGEGQGGWRWAGADGDKADDDAGEYLTNPAVYLTFRPGGLRSHTLWPRHDTADLDFVDFRILSHCLPSNRGDRITTAEGIQAAVEGATPDHISALARTGALLPRPMAAGLYDAARPWVRHSWYLTLLAHLQAAGHPGHHAPTSSIPARDFLGQLGVLLTRRTTRRFAREQIPLKELKSVLARALDGVSASGRRALVGCLDVEGIAPAIYEWNIHEGTLGPAISPLTRTDARSMAVGQSPVEGAAALILLTRVVDTSDARQYEMDIIDLGRLGQRICLLSEEAGLGVFLTPALADDPTLKSLKSPDPEKTVTYLFALGKKHVA
ncbi:MAG: nitroreductase family protein [Acidobacteriota bacterium]|nr:nitroreductase family protein [Acidobacteriota bacterium]